MKTIINQKDTSGSAPVDLGATLTQSLTPTPPEAPRMPAPTGRPAPDASGAGVTPVSGPSPLPPPSEPSDPGSRASPLDLDFSKENSPLDLDFSGEDNKLPPPEYKHHAEDSELLGSIRRYYKLGTDVSDEDAFDRMVNDRRWANNGLWNPFFRSAADDLNTALSGTDEAKRDLATMIDRFERMDTNGWESFFGNLGPALLQPENLVSMGVGKFAALGAKTAMKATARGLLSGAVVDGAANGLHNNEQQKALVELKLKKHYSAAEVAAATAIGAGASVLPGALFAGTSAFLSQRAWAKQNDMLIRAGDPALVGDISQEEAEAAHRLFRGAGSEDEGWFSRFHRGLMFNDTLKDSPVTKTGLVRDRVIQGMFDKFNPIKRAEESAGLAGESATKDKEFGGAYARFRMLARAGQVVEAAMTFAVPKRTARGGKEAYKDASGHTHSLFGTLAPLGEDMNQFLSYVGAKRLVTHPKLQTQFKNAAQEVQDDIRMIVDAGDLRMGHVTNWRALEEGRWGDVTQIVEESNHLWAQTHKNMKEYNRGLLEFARDSDLLGAEEVEDILKHNDFYAPFYKDMPGTDFEDSLGSNVVSSKGNFKSISENWTENYNSIKSLDRNLIDNTQRIIAASEQNHAYANLYKQFTEGNLKDVAEDWGFKAANSHTKGPKAISAKVAADIEVKDPKTKKVLKDADGNPITRKGSKTVYFSFEGSMHADMMMHALDNTGVVNVLRDNALLKMITTTPKRMLVAGVTLEPTYVIRNLIRDAITAGMFTEAEAKSMIPFAAQAVGFTKYSSDRTANSVAVASMNGVGVGSFRQASLADTLSEQAKKFYKSKGIKTKNVFKTFGDAYVHNINKVENASRLQEYDAVMKKTGGNELEASLAAANVSTDFTMRGSNGIITFANELFPFFNAGMQGIYTTMRKLDVTSDATRPQALKRLMVGFGILGGASMALETANSSIDVVQQLDPIIKDTHWVFALDANDNLTVSNEDAVDVFTVAKPYDVGFFANLMEYLVRFGKIEEESGLNYEDNEARDITGNLAQYFKSVVLLDPSSPVLNALEGLLAENPTNYAGQPVIPRSMEKTADTSQYTAGTPELWRKAGATLNMSPLRLQFAAESLLGTSMREVAKGLDHVPGFRDDGLGEGKRKPNREWTMTQLPVVRAFMQPGRPIPKAVGEFYALQHEIDKSDEAQDSYRNNGNQLDMATYMRHHPEYSKYLDAAPTLDILLGKVTKQNKHYRDLLNTKHTPAEVTELMDKVRTTIHADIVTLMAQLKREIPVIRGMIRKGED